MQQLPIPVFKHVLDLAIHPIGTLECYLANLNSHNRF